MNASTANFLGEKMGITSLSQLRALLALHEEGPLCKTDISRRVGMSPGGVTALTDSLTRLGLVRVALTKEDRRAHIISLTQEGTTLAAMIEASIPVTVSQTPIHQ